MQWLRVYFLVGAVCAFVQNATFTKTHLAQLRNRTKSLFLHGWDSYMQHGYPEDEVTPLTCQPYGKNSDNYMDLRNDVLGNYSVTFLDSLDTFVVMGDVAAFHNGIRLIESQLSFDKNSTVQVFETSIRALGSLLSLHLYASDPRKGYQMESYNGSLLRMAYDLGKRLLPAFKTSTGVPFARINLRYGLDAVPQALNFETCTAGGGSPMLEMTLLSRLTGDSVFEKVSKHAFMTLWNSRSSLDLLPMGLNPSKGKWLDSISGIGASIDSFYEYAMKGSILFQDPELLHIWQSSYSALLTHSRVNKYLFANVNWESGAVATPWIDSLSAFFPGLQVLAGKVEDAKLSHMAFYKLWNTFGSIPERWNFNQEYESSPINLEWYPLRPEFVESTYHLYRATKDPFYLQIGARILTDFETRFRARCGFAGIQDIRTNEVQDRMESFVLSETFKYLYLLFDEENPLHTDSSNWIFSTEGHPLWLDKSLVVPYESNLLVPQTVNLSPVPSSVSSAILEILADFGSKFGKDESFKRLKNYLTSGPEASLEFKKKLMQAKMKRVHMVGLKRYGLKAVDMEFHGLSETCENKGSNVPMFASPWARDGRFYEFDYSFAKTLRKPDYLESSDIELDSAFYNQWTHPNAQCRRVATTETVEFLFGKKEQIRFAQVDEVIERQSGRAQKTSETRVRAGDLWVPVLEGVRMKIEKLTLGAIDTRNQFINNKYLMSQLHFESTDDAEDSELCRAPEMMRVLTINGRKVQDNSRVWTSRKAIRQLDKSGLSVDIAEDGCVTVEGVKMENFCTWKK